MPEEVSTSIAMLRLPPMEELPPPLRGQTVVHLRFAYAGADTDEAERLLAPMKAAGTILLGFVGPMRTDETDGIHMDPVDPLPAWEKGMLLTDLTDEAVDAFLATAGPQLEIPLIMAEIRLMGGALARPATVPNAVPGRSAAYSVHRARPRRPGAGAGRAGGRPGRPGRARTVEVGGDDDQLPGRRLRPRRGRRGLPAGDAGAAAGGQARRSTRPASSRSATRSDR